MAKPEQLPLPVPGPVASAPVSHPPTPPLSLSGDEAKDGVFSILPHAPTPPPSGKNDLFDPFFGTPGIVIPPAELPAIQARAPPSAADNASDKGKQKEPEPLNLEPHIVEAIPDDKEIDLLVGKVPMTEHLEEWNVLDKDAGASAASAASAAEATTAVAKEKIFARPEEEKEVHIIPVAEAVSEEAPVPVEAPIGVAPIQIAAPIPELPKVEARRLEDEAITEVAKESVETVVSEIADAVDTPVSPEPKNVEFPVVTPAEAIAPVTEPAVEQAKAEVIAPETEQKMDEVKVENVVQVEVVEAGPSVPEAAEELQAIISDERKEEEEEKEEKEEVAPVPQIVDTSPEENISKVVPQEAMPEPTPEVEPAPVETPVREDDALVKEDDTPVKEDDSSAEDKIVEPEPQPPMTPPTERSLDLPIVGDVSPRIPTPPDAAGNSLDWDKLVEEICKTHESDEPLSKTEDLVTEIPGVVAVGGTEMPKEETFTILPVPASTLPQDVIEDLTPAPVKYTPPAPLPPRKIEDEEKPRIPEITVGASTSIPEPVQSSSPVKSEMPDLPEFGNHQAPEEQLRTRPRPSPSIISRPSLADIREEADLEDAELVVAAPAAREEPVVAPVITDVVNPVDTIKLVQPEVIPAPPPVRNLNDEMADETEEWVPKYKETGAGNAAAGESEIRPATPPTKVPEAETTTPLERVETHAPSAKEKSALRKLGRTFSFGSKKIPHMGDLRPGTSHSAAVSVGSVDDDRKSMAESTKRPNFLTRTSTKRMLTLGLAGKDKDKKKDNASVTGAEGVISPAGKAASIRSVAGVTSPVTESPPTTPVKRNPRDLMKLAIGMKKKQQEAGADSAPVSPIDGASPATTPLASPALGASKRLNMSNAVNLMMRKKRDQDAKVKSAEAQAAAVAAAASPPPTAVAPVAAETPAVESAPPTPAAATETPTETPTEEAPAPPPAPRRRNTITMNNAVNLMLLRKKAKEDKPDVEKAAPSAPGTPGADDSAVAVEDDKPATPSGAEVPVENAIPRRRNTLTLKGAADLMSFRKKVKEEKEEHDKANRTSSDAAVDDSAVDTSAPEVSPPATPKRKGTLAMNNAVNLMMMRKNKDKDKGKEKEGDESSPDGDSAATTKKDKRMSMGAVFGRKKSSPNSPTIGTSASRPRTPSTPAAEAMKSTTSFVSPPLESENPGVGLAIDADSSKQPSKAPSVYSVDQRPGTSASTRNFGGLFKKRTPSVYSKDTPDSPNPFNAPNSPFPPANGADRPGPNQPETSPASEGEDGETKPKFNRRWSVALGARGKSSSKLANVEVPGSSGGLLNTSGTTGRPGTSASMTQGPVSPSKIPVPTAGTVPSTTANGEKRPKLAEKAKTFMAFNRKKQI